MKFLISLICVILPMYLCKLESSIRIYWDYAILITDLPKIKYGGWQMDLQELEEEDQKILCERVRKATIFVFQENDRGKFPSLAKDNYHSLNTYIWKDFFFQNKKLYALQCEFNDQLFYIGKHEHYDGHILFMEPEQIAGIFIKTYEISSEAHKQSDIRIIGNTLNKNYNSILSNFKKKFKVNFEEFQQRKLSVSVFMIMLYITAEENKEFPQEWLLHVNRVKRTYKFDFITTPINLPYVIKCKFDWPLKLKFTERIFYIVPYNELFDLILIEYNIITETEYYVYKIHDNTLL